MMKQTTPYFIPKVTGPTRDGVKNMRRDFFEAMRRLSEASEPTQGKQVNQKATERS